jgi:hypothetical protein
LERVTAGFWGSLPDLFGVFLSGAIPEELYCGSKVGSTTVHLFGSHFLPRYGFFDCYTSMPVMKFGL